MTAGDSTAARPFSVKLAAVATSVSVGASLTAVMLIVVVCAVLRLFEPCRRSTSQVTVRVGSAP